jgi:hypothetical protein
LGKFSFFAHFQRSNHIFEYIVKTEWGKKTATFQISVSAGYELMVTFLGGKPHLSVYQLALDLNRVWLLGGKKPHLSGYQLALDLNRVWRLGG